MDPVVNLLPITSADLAPIRTVFNEAVDLAVPIGIGIMSIRMGIRYVVKLVKSLAR